MSLIIPPDIHAPYEGLILPDQTGLINAIQKPLFKNTILFSLVFGGYPYKAYMHPTKGGKAIPFHKNFWWEDKEADQGVTPD